MTVDSNGDPGSAMLDVRDVAVHFGGIVALDGVSFDIPSGSIVGLIGPNGAGKTTLFNCLSRLYTPNSGDILFKGRSILEHAADRIAALGIGRTFQNLALFPTLSRSGQCHDRRAQPNAQRLHLERRAASLGAP